MVDRTMATTANFVACGGIRWRMVAYGSMGGGLLPECASSLFLKT